MVQERIEYWELLLSHVDIFSGTPQCGITIHRGTEIQVCVSRDNSIDSEFKTFQTTAEGLCEAIDWVEATKKKKAGMAL